MTWRKIFLKLFFISVLFFLPAVVDAASDFCIINPGKPNGGSWFHQTVSIDSTKTYSPDDLTALSTEDNKKDAFFSGASSLVGGKCEDEQAIPGKICSEFTKDFTNLNLKMTGECSDSCSVDDNTGCLLNTPCSGSQKCKITYAFANGNPFSKKKTTGQGSGSTPDSTQLFNPLEGIISSDKPVQTLAAKLISAMFGIAGSVALFMFVLGGFLWLVSAGNSEWVSKGKNIFIWSSLGLTVMFSSYVIVNYIFKDVLGSSGVGAAGTAKPGNGTSGSSGPTAKGGCCLNLDQKTVTDIQPGDTCPSQLLDGVKCSNAKLCFAQDVASCKLFANSDSCGSATEYPSTQLAACVAENSNGFCCVDPSKLTLNPITSKQDPSYDVCVTQSSKSPQPFVSDSNSQKLYTGLCSAGKICLKAGAGGGCDYAPSQCPPGSVVQFDNASTANMSACWLNYYSNNADLSGSNTPYCLAKVPHANGIVDTDCVAIPNSDLLSILCPDKNSLFSSGSTKQNEIACKAKLTTAQPYCLQPDDASKLPVDRKYSCVAIDTTQASSCKAAFNSGQTSGENNQACSGAADNVSAYQKPITVGWCCVQTADGTSSKLPTSSNAFTHDDALAACGNKFNEVYLGQCAQSWCLKKGFGCQPTAYLDFLKTVGESSTGSEVCQNPPNGIYSDYASCVGANKTP